MVYRLVTANTIDEKIVERAAAKRKLEKMIIHSKKFKSQVINLADYANKWLGNCHQIIITGRPLLNPQSFYFNWSCIYRLSHNFMSYYLVIPVHATGPKYILKSQ